MQTVTKTDETWRHELTPEQYRVLREKGTEAPFTGAYYASTRRGTYACAACGNDLFSSDAKFDSGTGWPSFFKSATPSSVELHADKSLGVERTEVICARCGGHLGHLFNDGPEPTGQRYCMNSCALDLKEEA